ncbi:MAG: alanine racemase [Neoaquamicrobium sediminum]|uniref:alanine racemase n=1 Tax=Neoaquamicrobium sediminum TaxID=1849104 RepID=UPI004035B9A6
MSARRCGRVRSPRSISRRSFRLAAAVELTESAEFAAVAKANACEARAPEVATALQGSGRNTYFVGHLEEGFYYREAIDFSSRVVVLNGTPPVAENEFLRSVPIPATEKWSGITAGIAAPTAAKGGTSQTIRFGLCGRVIGGTTSTPPVRLPS